MSKPTVLVVRRTPLSGSDLLAADSLDLTVVHSPSIRGASRLLAAEHYPAVCLDLDLDDAGAPVETGPGMAFAALIANGFPRVRALLLTSERQAIKADSLPDIARFVPGPVSMALLLRALMNLHDVNV